MAKPIKEVWKQFEKFMHYQGKRAKSILVPDLTEGVAQLGHIEAIEYLSDKMIYPSDRKPKVRLYRHDFEKPEKTPVYVTADGDFLLIKLPKPIKPEGIVG